MADSILPHRERLPNQSLCPTCGLPSIPERAVLCRKEGTMNGNYDCVNGHIWAVRWPAVAA